MLYITIYSYMTFLYDEIKGEYCIMDHEELEEYLVDEKYKIGKEITRTRETNGLTQLDLVNKTDVSLKTLSRMENGNDNYTIDNLLTVLKENGQALLVVNKTEREEVAREYIYDTIVKFLIALPFASTLDLNEALHHIQLDFRRMNMSYVCKQLDNVIKRTSRNELYKSLIEKSYQDFKHLDEDGVIDHSTELTDKEFSFMMEYLQAKVNFSLLMMQDDVWKLYLKKHLKMDGMKGLVDDIL